MVGPDGTLAYPWLADGLARALQVDAHAVLLHGAAGIGQWELSVTLAQAWLCETDGPRKPCGQCASCRLVGARSHPDLMVLVPEALQESLGWGSGEDDAAATEKSGKTRQPSKDIKVDAVRAAVGFAQTTSARGLGKVVVVHPAERLNGVAANALLKTLEEPPGAARFVLSSAAPDALLPTIRSRCQALPLGLPPHDQAVVWLESLGIAQAAVLLAATGGQPLEARAWAEQGVDAAAWSRVPRCVAQGDATLFAGWPMPRLIDTLHKLCHDAMCVGCGAAPRYFPRESLPAGAKLAALIEWSRALGRAARHAEHPFNAALMAESLVGQGQRAMASGARRHAATQGVSVHSRA